MKLFVYEYITSGALIDESLPESLAHEGDAILNAILNDLSLFEHIQLFCMRDARLAASTFKVTCKPILSQADYLQTLQTYLDQCDYVLVIAPETDDILLKLKQHMPDAKFLGCSEQAIKISSNKYLTYQHLTAKKINTAATMLVNEWLQDKSRFSNVIVKPIDGAGCIETFVFTHQQASQHIENLTVEQQQKLIIQPMIEGTAASISCFIDQHIHILNINEQFLRVEKQQLKFEQCKNTVKVNAMLNTENALSLIKSVCDAIQGLWGFIGIDLVLTEQGPVIIEINPRLTTAYLDLKNHLDFNPAQLLIQALTDK